MTSSSPQDLLGSALSALGRKERSVAELETWLRRRGTGEDEVEATVARLIEIGALDDERFAHRYAEDKRDLAGWASQRIREALEARGVDEGLIDQALADEGEGEVERAIGLLAARHDELVDDAARGRAFGFLARRGYPAEIAYEAIRIAGRRAA